MRSCPIGVLSRIADILAVAERQARITHDADGGVRSSQAVALTTHYFLYRLGAKADLPAFLAAHLGGEWSTPHRGKVGPDGLVAARAAITALMAETSMSGLLRRCIDFGGDVDTVAAIALGAASCSPDYAQDLPRALHDGLERGPWGRDYLLEVDGRLLRR
jgi:ADP-ribosyl-[dinitrogen reductase] hydrolase